MIVSAYAPVIFAIYLHVLSRAAFSDNDLT